MTPRNKPPNAHCTTLRTGTPERYGLFRVFSSPKLRLAFSYRPILKRETPPENSLSPRFASKSTPNGSLSMKFISDVPIEDTWSSDSTEAKQLELRLAIEQLDRKFARKLIIDEEVQPVAVESRQLLRFLYVAVQSRDPALVRELLKQKPDLNNLEGGIMLWVVAEDGDTEIASMLVRAGADCNWQRANDAMERGLLHVLIASDNPRKHQLAILMMEHGANVDVEDASGDAPLDYAVKKDSFEIVEELIKRGAVVDEFVVGAAASHPRSVELVPILVGGRFADAETTGEKVALTMIYLCSVDVDEARILPVIEALMDIRVPEDEVVLFSAVLCGRAKIVELFLDRGFGQNVLSVLLHLATSLEQSTIAELLIKRGANINYRVECEEFGHKNQYPIHTACENSSTSNVKLLLRLGADINTTDSDGATPFSLIEDANLNDVKKEVIKHFAMLISKGVKINDGDLKLVRSKADSSKFFDECFDELRNMREVKVFNHISFHTMLITDVKKLSWLTRNCSLVENYNKAKLKALFPLYHAEVEWKFRNSERRKKLLLSQEQAACEVLNDKLPNLAVAKIIFYLYMTNVKDFQCSMNI